ncbi:MAG: SpaH/EbpB family LPXTG-anchored major pilin [Lachnospiraceae bacterium]|nr:SpaH/EbpB family LPXTG-anchored major pilin [Lachnospiraceae bacterium]
MKKNFSKLGAMLIAVFMLVSMFSTTAFAAVTSLPDNETERVLNLYKYSPTTSAGDHGDGTVDEGAATGRIPLENVEFEIYKVPVKQATSATPTDAEITAIKKETNLVTTIKTDAAGLATHNFGKGNANDGIYLIVEKDNPAVSTKADPFYLNMPLTNPTEDAWMYTVTVYPKNDVPDGPTPDKDVTSVGNKVDTADIGDIVTWIIRGDIPADLYRTVVNPEYDANVQGSSPTLEVYAKNYSFTDDLDTRLDYKGNVIVKLYDKAGTETTLDSDYYSTSDTTAVVENAGGTLKVSLTNSGMKYIMQNLGTGTETPEIRVYFDTAINDTAQVATEIENNVTLDYTNSSGNKYEPTEPEEKPHVHTGGLLIDKYDSKTSAKLAGAEFMIARDATQAEIDAGTGVETIKVGGVDKRVVFIDFYDTDAIEGERVTKVTTDKNGKAVLNGLAYGSYYLVETKAPDGYNLLSAPITVTVNDTSHLTANAIKVENSSKFELPVTGGEGTLLFTMGGVLLIGMACILLVLTRKKRANAK